jgi:hypothetical protein
MPLTPGAPASQTIPELHTGKTYAHTAAKFGKNRAQKQSIAIALSNERKGRAIGGVANYDDGGAVNPVQQVITALNAGASQSGNGTAGIGATNPSAPSSAPVTAAQTAATSGVAPTTTATPMVTSPSVTPTQATGVANTTGANSTVTPAVAQNTTTSLPPPTTATVATGQPSTPIANKLMAGGGGLMGGSTFASPKPPAPPGWQVRQEARGLHSGPILSAVPGRTDNHMTRVKSGSYVLPAATVSSLGQSNSVAGLSIAHKMFGGPYGSSPMKMARGPGAPKPPHPPKMFASGGWYSEGGSRGDGHDGEGVDVALSGGEYVLSPESIIHRWGSLKNGHAVLDAFVMANRKKEIETLKKLPPPAKK